MVDTARTKTDLLTALFQDGQASNAITEQDVRDFIVSTMLKDDALGSTTGGWRDNRASLVAAATGSGTPALATFGTSANIKQLSFAIGDSVYIAMHVDHDIKPSSTAYMHVHWSTDGVDTNTVKWEIACVTAAGHDTANFGADVITSLTEAGAGTAWRHMITEDVTGITAPDPDTLLIMELKRVTNGGTNNTDNVYGLFVDMHYETDRISTKNRTPNFYA